jgi:hypothetical protein
LSIAVSSVVIFTGGNFGPPSTWGPDIVYLRLNPRWMVGYDGEASGDSAD